MARADKDFGDCQVGCSAVAGGKESPEAQKLLQTVALRTMRSFNFTNENKVKRFNPKL